MASSAGAKDARRATVLLVDDEVLARVGMTTALEHAGFQIIPTASAEEALQVLAAVPDIHAIVASAELSSAGMNSADLTWAIRAEWPTIPILVVSDHAALEEDKLPSGAHLIGKPVHGSTLALLVAGMVSNNVVPAPVRRTRERYPTPRDLTVEGTPALSPRQRSVLQLLAQGKSNRDIALALDISPNTVKVHLVSIYRALGVSSRVEALLAGKSLLERMQLKRGEEQPPSHLS